MAGKSGKYIVLAHGTDVEMVHTREIISRTNPEALAKHQPGCANEQASAAGV
jgi:hypothetical protein